MNMQPVYIHFQVYEIEKKITIILVVAVMLLVFVLAFLCLGCVFRANINLNDVMRKIRIKMNKMKNKSK